MPKYTVGVHYEQGFTVDVTASSEEEAEKIVIERVEDRGDDCEGFIDTVHRDYFVTDVIED